MHWLIDYAIVSSAIGLLGATILVVDFSEDYTSKADWYAGNALQGKRVQAFCVGFFTVAILWPVFVISTIASYWQD